MYLIFFGKAQSFIFYAFDENGIVVNFNKIIPDLDLLESQLLNVDREENKDIFAKYIFTKGSQDPYSLIKIYSPAQPSQGFRIEGCIYGVAFLSKQNLKISKYNIQALNTIQKAFGSLVLSGIKFLKTDFIEEATVVFNRFHQQKVLSLIESNNEFENKSYNVTTAVYVNNLLNFDTDIGGFSNKIYITEDIDRLLRAQKKWGEKSLKLLQQINSSFVEYKEVKAVNAFQNTQSIKLTNSESYIQSENNQGEAEKVLLRLKIKDTEKQILLFEQKLKNASNNNKNLKISLKLSITVLILMALAMGVLLYKKYKPEQVTITFAGKAESEITESQQNIQNITIDNTIDVMQKWEKKKELVDFVNLIIKLEEEKKSGQKDTLKGKIIKKGFDNEMDTTTIKIFLKNI